VKNYFEIHNSTLLKLISLNSLSIFLRIGIGVVVSKFLAVFVGPSGMALVGNLRNFLTTIEGFSVFGFQNGVVKLIADNKLEINKKKQIVSTVCLITFIAIFIVSILILVFIDIISKFIFNSSLDYNFMFKILVLCLPFYSFSVLFLSVLNGLELYKKVITINIIGSIIGLFISVFLIANYNLNGALLSIIITPSILFFITFYYINKEIELLNYIRFKNYNKEIAKSLFAFSSMALYSAILAPVISIIIRNYIIETNSIDHAGFWDAITRISSYYMLFVSAILSLYFLPKLTVSNSALDTNKVYLEYYKTILPIFIIGVIFVFFTKDLIISILFTNEFNPVSELFFWQLVGDVFKVFSWVLALQFLAKKQVKNYFITETISFIILITSSIICINMFDLKGVVIAHAITYFVYAIMMLFFAKKELFSI